MKIDFVQTTTFCSGLSVFFKSLIPNACKDEK